MLFADLMYLMLCFSGTFLLLQSEQFTCGFFNFSQEYFLAIYGLQSGLLGAKLTVVLLAFCGVYLGDTEPAPNEADSALGLESMQLAPYTNFLYQSTVNFLLSSTEVDISLLQDISSSIFLNDFTSSCDSIQSIVILLFGLNTRILSKRSTQHAGKSLRIEAGLLDSGIFIYFIIERETSDSNEFISSSEGYPVNEHIFYICYKVQLPLNRGF